jgi:DNA-directed RNA polymerase alpha subunit
VYDDYYNEILHSKLFDNSRIIYEGLSIREKMFIMHYYKEKMKLEDIAAAINRSTGFVYAEHDRLLNHMCVKIIDATIGFKDSFDISYLKLSEGIRYRLIMNGCDTIGKILDLDQDELCSIDGFGKIKVNRLIKALDEAKIEHNFSKI